MPRRLNLQHPLQARNWLKLLVEDPDCGFRIHPNITRPKELLGFSMSSNGLGLRGPSATGAGNVIFGTSFAMGIAVDNGDNWHDQCLAEADWLNLGLPVGIDQWAELFKRYHTGPKERAVLIYHPNIWTHCVLYDRWKRSGKSLFTALNWKTQWPSCAVLSLKIFIRKQIARNRGLITVVSDGASLHEIDSRYAQVDVGRHGQLVEKSIDRFSRLVSEFRQVHVIKVPIKQELVAEKSRTRAMDAANNSFGGLWSSFSKKMAAMPNVSIKTFTESRLEDFHPADSHWNANGNRRFSQWFSENI